MAVNNYLSLRCIIKRTQSEPWFHFWHLAVSINQKMSHVKYYVSQELRLLTQGPLVCVAAFFNAVAPSTQDHLFSTVIEASNKHNQRNVRRAEGMPHGLQMLHPVTCPRGVSHKFSGSQVAISYLCVTYQSCLQPEKAINTLKPLAFVHSSLMNLSRTQPHHTNPRSLCLSFWHKECEEEQGRRRRSNADAIIISSMCDLWGHGSLSEVHRSFCTHRAALRLGKAPGYERTKNYKSGGASKQIRR